MIYRDMTQFKPKSFTNSKTRSRHECVQHLVLSIGFLNDSGHGLGREGWLFLILVGRKIDEFMVPLRGNISSPLSSTAEPRLDRVIMSTAKKYRPRYASYPRRVPHARETAERPKQVRSKIVTIDGKEHVVKIFEPNPPRSEPPVKKLLLVPFSDSAIFNWSKSNRPDYLPKIDIRKALAQLQRRWAIALLLMCVEHRSAEEVGEILGCSVPRVYRLVQLAKDRMRELMPRYARNGQDNPEFPFLGTNVHTETKRLPSADVLPHGAPIRIVPSLGTPSSQIRSGARHGT